MRKQIGVRLEETDIEWLDAEAARRGKPTTRSSLLDEAIEVLRHGGKLPADARKELEARGPKFGQALATQARRPKGRDVLADRQARLNKERGKK